MPPTLCVIQYLGSRGGVGGGAVSKCRVGHLLIRTLAGWFLSVIAVCCFRPGAGVIVRLWFSITHRQGSLHNWDHRSSQITPCTGLGTEKFWSDRLRGILSSLPVCVVTTQCVSGDHVRPGDHLLSRGLCAPLGRGQLNVFVAAPAH